MKPISVWEICRAVGGSLSVCGLEEKQVLNVSTDTRKIEKDSLFIPIKGEKFDGHDFIDQAFEKGALCCLSEKEFPTERLVIFVESTRKALLDLAAYYRSLFDVKVCAVTGSVGKTTTKDMIASVLSQKYSVLKTQGNFNNEIGLPLTVFNLDDTYGAAVFELGMNNFGEISRLTAVARPDAALITNIGVSHIENLGSREGILKAKCEIFEGLKEGGCAILNGEDDMLLTLKGKEKFRTLWFGGKDGCVTAENVNEKGVEGVDFEMNFYGQKAEISLKSPGKHMVLNALAAAAVGKEFDLNIEEIKAGLESFCPTGMRMEIIKTGKNITVINDSYNANPVSMKAAIDVLCQSGGFKTAIMGDMLELGKYGAAMHMDVGKYAAQKGADRIICIGEAAYDIYKGAAALKKSGVFYYRSLEEFFDRGFDKALTENGTVLVKASHSMAFNMIAERLKGVK